VSRCEGGPGPFRVRSSRGVHLAFRDVGSGPRFQGYDDPRGSGVTGGWPFPFPPRPYPLPGGPSRSSARSATSGLNRPSYPLALGSPSELLSRADRLSPAFLSWDSSGRALARASPVPPLRRHALTRPLPSDVAAGLRARAASSSSRSVPVVLHHLDGFLRVGVAGLLHPAANPEVRRVSWDDRRILPKQPWSIVAFPCDAHHTPRRTSSTAAALRHRSRCPLVVPLLAKPSTSRLSSTVESVMSCPRCRWPASCPSWALFPSKVLFRVPRIDRVTPGVVVPALRGGWGVRQAPSAPACEQQAARRRAPDRGQGGPAYRRSGPGPGAPRHRSGTGRSELRVAEATGNKPRIGRVIRR